MSRDQNSQHREISDGLADWRENGNPPEFEGLWADGDDDEWMYEWGDEIYEGDDLAELGQILIERLNRDPES